MSLVDVGVLIIIGGCVISGYKNGLLFTLYRFISFFGALLASWFLFPVLSRLLAATPLYDMLRNMVSNTFDLEARAEVFNPTELIDSLPLPNMITDMLHANAPANLPVQEADIFVSSTIATMILNGMSIIIIFILVSFGFTFLGGLVNLVGRLPVIKQFNRLGGVILGLLIGGILSWLALALFIMIVAFTASEGMAFLIENSFVVRTIMGGDVVVDRISP